MPDQPFPVDELHDPRARASVNGLFRLAACYREDKPIPSTQWARLVCLDAAATICALSLQLQAGSDA